VQVGESWGDGPKLQQPGQKSSERPRCNGGGGRILILTLAKGEKTG